MALTLKGAQRALITQRHFMHDLKWGSIFPFALCSTITVDSKKYRGWRANPGQRKHTRDPSDAHGHTTRKTVPRAMCLTLYLPRDFTEARDTHGREHASAHRCFAASTHPILTLPVVTTRAGNSCSSRSDHGVPIFILMRFFSSDVSLSSCLCMCGRMERG